MRLASLIEGTPELVTVVGDPQTEIEALCDHSAQTIPGSLFIAIRGFRNDGHDFIGEAVERRAAAVAGEDRARLDPFRGEVVTVLTTDSRAIAARCATRFYGHPSRRLKLVGITGTNGKTTTCYLTEAILRAAGLKTALVTTVQTRVGEDTYPSIRTTPEPLQLQRLLREALDRGVTHAVLEISSHGIALSRILGCEFDVVALTNVTRDHLDFHSSFDDYLEAKLRLFTEYARENSKDTVGVVNIDEPAGKVVKQRAECPVVTCGATSDADLRVVAARSEMGGTRLEVETAEGRQELVLPLYGGFNSANGVMAAGIALALALPWETIVRGLETAKAPPGRLERIDEGQPFLVFVDYAHTPDSLRRALEAVRGLCERRVILVFGCGGDRDKGKRPLMGQVAASQADFTVVTSDNPRSEEPEHIIADILAGMGGSKPVVEPDRAKAIRLALEEAKGRDAVLIAGKGHETYQIFKDNTVHFSDQEVAREGLREIWGTQPRE